MFYVTQMVFQVEGAKTETSATIWRVSNVDHSLQAARRQSVRYPNSRLFSILSVNIKIFKPGNKGQFFSTIKRMQSV